MAPTRSTQSRPATRKNGGTLCSLVTGINKRFQCIICEKHLGSRAALSRHVQSHKTRPEELSPFPHRSCWDDDVAIYPPGRQKVLDMIVDDEEFEALPPKMQQAINNKITYAFAGVKNKKQLQWKAEQKHLRLLYWWFRANEESLRARMEFGPEGLFPQQGERKLQDQGEAFYAEGITAEADSLLKIANPPPIPQYEPLPTAGGPTTSAATTTSAETGYFDHDFGRSLNGSVIADFELSSTRPLTSLPLLWCISNAFTSFVKAHEENVSCLKALQKFAETYLVGIGSFQEIVDELNLRFDKPLREDYNVDQIDDTGDKWAALLLQRQRFRRDRAFIWKLVEKAVDDYFNDHINGELPMALAAGHSSEVRIVVEATRKFVAALGDAETAMYLHEYLLRMISTCKYGTRYIETVVPGPR